MKNMVMHKQGEHSWITYIKSRIKQNLNFMAIAEGQTGVGKSWSMLSVSYLIDPDFTVDQVAFSFRDVMKIIVDPTFQKKKWKVILFDEAQTDINNRTWQSLSNKLMLYLTSTFRHQNIIFLMTSPYSDFMDSATMKLVHCKFIMKGVNRKTGLSNCRPKLQQYNGKMKKFYEHSLVVSSKKGTIKITNWGIPKPPKHLVDLYEEKKTEFTSQLNLDIKRQLDEAFEKAQGKKKEPELPEGYEKDVAQKLLDFDPLDREIFYYVRANPKETQTNVGLKFGKTQNKISILLGRFRSRNLDYKIGGFS